MSAQAPEETLTLASFLGLLTQQRLAPARQWLRTTGAHRLEEPLGERLLPLARMPAEFRFLTQRLATVVQVEALLARAPTPDLAAELRVLAEKRQAR